MRALMGQIEEGEIAALDHVCRRVHALVTDTKGMA